MAAMEAKLILLAKDSFSGVMKKAAESVESFDKNVENTSVTLTGFNEKFEMFNSVGDIAMAFNNITLAAQKLYSPIKEVIDLTAKFNDSFNQAALQLDDFYANAAGQINYQDTNNAIKNIKSYRNEVMNAAAQTGLSLSEATKAVDAFFNAGYNRELTLDLLPQVEMLGSCIVAKNIG